MTVDLETESKKELSAKQERAAYLLSIGSKIVDVAEQIGVSRSTISNWNRNSHFQVRINQFREEMRKTIEWRILTLAETAVSRLSELVESEDDRIAFRLVVCSKGQPTRNQPKNGQKHACPKFRFDA